MNEHLCSVIIPSYNHQEYVVQAVKSVLDQSYKEIEVIVIDDGSSDASVQYLERIDDARLKVITQTNSGAHAAINKGFNLANGTFITILNSDDLYLPMRIKKAIDFFSMNPDIDFISTWIEIINKNGTLKGIKKGWCNYEPWHIKNPTKSYQSTDDFVLNSLMWNFVSTTSNFIMRKKVVETIGLMRNLRFVHDWDYLLRIVDKFKCKLLPEPLLKYRIHDRNTISTDKKKMLFEICWLLATHIPNFEGKYIFQDSNQFSSLRDFQMLYESISFQGNDKLFWVMRSFFESQKKCGVLNPEDFMLNDDFLKENLVKLVIEDTSKNRYFLFNKFKKLVKRFVNE